MTGVSESECERLSERRLIMISRSLVGQMSGTLIQSPAEGILPKIHQSGRAKPSLSYFSAEQTGKYLRSPSSPENDQQYPKAVSHSV